MRSTHLAESLVGRGAGITAIAPAEASLTEPTGPKADIIADPRYRSGVAHGVTIEGLDR